MKARIVIVKAIAVREIAINLNACKLAWQSPFLREKMLDAGFQEGQEFWCAYKYGTDDIVLIADEQEEVENDTSNTTQDSKAKGESKTSSKGK
jgi:hypothetical protein